jgi:predicted alpha/beta-fold hydrolase
MFKFKQKTSTSSFRLLYFLLLTLIGGDLFAISPKKEYLATPASYGIAYEAYTIETSDNISLNVWVSEPKESGTIEGTVLMSYGDYGNMSYFLKEVKSFVDAGYRIITYDYRGFGDSENWTFSDDLLYDPEFATDFNAAYSFGSSRYGDLIFYSISMGSIAQIKSKYACNASLWILDSPVYRLDEVARRLLAIKGKQLTYDPSLEVLPWDKINNPMLILSANDDQITTSGDHQLMCNQLNNRKLFSYSCGHGNGLNCLGSVLFTAIKRSLSQ